MNEEHKMRTGAVVKAKTMKELKAKARAEMGLAPSKTWTEDELADFDTRYDVKVDLERDMIIATERWRG
ncbi:MAG: hypothetical protein CML66_25945 [Rhodobacteraceae bacterium]|nr:hypothetical protein [Paracoccaceae bacterium]MAY43901.1 hypothetical protein [Paracoccaceae bacterium]